jgi:hypothetical protein
LEKYSIFIPPCDYLNKIHTKRTSWNKSYKIEISLCTLPVESKKELKLEIATNSLDQWISKCIASLQLDKNNKLIKQGKCQNNCINRQLSNALTKKVKPRQ